MNDSDKESKTGAAYNDSHQQYSEFFTKENILAALGCKRSDFSSEDYSDDEIFE